MLSSTRDMVLTIGRIYCDLIFTDFPAMPQQGREVFASGFKPVLGGGALIMAANSAALGRRTALVARYGTDPLSEALEPQLHAIGVDTQFIERSADAGPQVTVAMVKAAERAFLSHRAGAVEPRTTTNALSHPQAAHLHIAEFSTLVEIPDLVNRAREHGLTVSLDPSWDDTLIQNTDLIDRCRGVEVFLPNFAEGRAITGKSTPQDVLDTLAPHFRVVALKLGRDGAMLRHAGETIILPAPPVEVVDTTGAGDAFNAGFINAWLLGGAPGDWLQAGIAAGSRSVQIIGGIELNGIAA